MKKLPLILMAFGFLAACNQGDKKSANAAEIKPLSEANATLADTENYTTLEWLDSTKQDFGVISEGQVLEVSFKFKNTGEKPLIITNATASCGCTVAEKPEKPILPGEEGYIKGKFDSNGRAGTNNKHIYVTANTKPTTNHDLNFTVEVRHKS